MISADFGLSSSARRFTLCRCAVILPAVFALAFFPGCSSKGSSRSSSSSGGNEDAQRYDSERSPSFREILVKNDDLGGCREALRLLNNSDAFRPAEGSEDTASASNIRTLEAKRKEELSDPALLGIGKVEFDEIEGDHYTLLDGRHLDRCFLFYDVARSLSLVDQKKLSVLEKASLAFDWSMRQVMTAGHSLVVPPEFTLRMGRGNGLERGLVFLALLEQTGCEGCLAFFPGDKKDDPKHIVCGVLDDKGSAPQLYLFDPSLGIPLPGPDGRGVATLQNLRNQEHLLAPLGVTKGDIYKVTPDEIELVSTLSSLAPRNAYLQKMLWESGTKVKLADPDIKSKQKRFQAVVEPASSASGAIPVHYSAAHTGLLRSFLPATEGGSDASIRPFALGNMPGYAPERLNDMKVQTPLMYAYQWMMLDWRGFPTEMRELDYQSELGQTTRNTYMMLFMPYYGGSPKLGRDLLLRGLLDEAADKLTKDREELPNLAGLLALDPATAASLFPNKETTEETKEQQDWLKQINSKLPSKVAKWCSQVNELYGQVLLAEREKNASKAEAARAEMAAIADSGRTLWLALLQASTAENRAFLASFQLALCQHERAERLQERLRRSGASANSNQKEKARDAWDAAASTWNQFIRDYSQMPQAVHGSTWYARALAMQGNADQAARVLTQAFEKAQLTETERLAREFTAKQLQKN
jgi:hypothetical protein